MGCSLGVGGGWVQRMLAEGRSRVSSGFRLGGSYFAPPNYGINS